MGSTKGDRDASRQAMLATNVRQQDYYESRFEAKASGRSGEERAANRPTRVWTHMRRRIQRLRSSVGVDHELIELHREWLGDLRNARVLDLGCFTGNRLSSYMAATADEYLGVDLSEQAAQSLDEALKQKGYAKASAIAMDFLDNQWPDGHFDCVYAYSVLHHFADLETALHELRRIVKPGGVIITMDPLSTDPFNRLARLLYRPFQSDRDWEYPFTARTLRLFQEHFMLEEVQGLQGVVKLSYPLLLIPGLGPLALKMAAGLRSFDFSHARNIGLPLYLCWHISMKLRCR
jgi:SAM-dependent methyltransferase